MTDENETGSEIEGQKIAAAEEPPEPVFEDYSYLGREFLTWLVFHVETAEGKFAGATSEENFSISFGARATLRSLAAAVGELKVSGETPVDSTDVRFAIAGGLTPREASMTVVRGRATWGLTLTDGFDLKNVKLPDSGVEGAGRDAGEDALASAEPRLLDRLGRLEELDSMIERAFGHFLSLRRSDAWALETVPSMRDWLVGSLSEG